LEANGLTDFITVLDKPCLELTAGDFGGGVRTVDAVIGEPFFSSSLLPWHNLHYWYALTALRKHMSPQCVVLPNTASLMAIAGE
jgi:protein arginine N-methyltransferase 7